MKNISLIAVIDEDYGIGKNNQLLCHLPADLKHFREMTLGKPVIMGRKTFLSIGKPLPERQNIVLSRTMEPVEGVDLAHSMEESLKHAGNAKEIMIIGGEGVFQEFMPFARQIYLTLVHHRFCADVFFPEIDNSQWHCNKSTFRPCDEKNTYNLTFKHYLRF